MTIQIKSTKDLKDDGVKLLVYGESGMGKTVLSSTAKDVLVVSAEGGLLSLSKNNLLTIHPNDPIVKANATNGIKVIEIQQPAAYTYENADQPLQQLRDIYQFLASPQAKDIKTVVIDSISEISEIVLACMVGKTKDDRQAYKELRNKMIAIVRNYRDLPKNIVFIAKQNTEKNDNGAIVKVTPAMAGKKLGEDVAYQLDCVFYMKNVSNEQGQLCRVLATRPDSDFCEYIAKTRNSTLPIYVNPHLEQIFEMINKGE